jgi:hypothetical protein
MFDIPKVLFAIIPLSLLIGFVIDWGARKRREKKSR